MLHNKYRQTCLKWVSFCIYIYAPPKSSLPYTVSACVCVLLSTTTLTMPPHNPLRQDEPIKITANSSNNRNSQTYPIMLCFFVVSFRTILEILRNHNDSSVTPHPPTFRSTRCQVTARFTLIGSAWAWPASASASWQTDCESLLVCPSA